MILLSKIMRQVLFERLSFSQLMKASKNQPDSSRIDRAAHVRTKSLGVRSMEDREVWLFSYKSRFPHSTTGKRFQGYIKFFKEDVSEKDNAEDLDCMVYCNCPDYWYRWSYNNLAAGASDKGATTPPKPKGPPHFGVSDMGVGLCKHLIALGNYLKTQINPEAPEPPDVEKQSLPVKKVIKKEPVTPTSPQTIKAPEPDDNYIDTRSSSDTLQEGKSLLFERMSWFVATHPEFEVIYED